MLVHVVFWKDDDVWCVYRERENAEKKWRKIKERWPNENPMIKTVELMEDRQDWLDLLEKGVNG